MKINLTDHELNEWVLNKLFEGPVLMPLDFCNNLNHTRLMAEKIREMGKASEYAFVLCTLIDRIGTDFEEIDEAYFDLAHASARQRCEAAWLVFQK